jgi:cation diffusion facilitator family transporter
MGERIHGQYRYRMAVVIAFIANILVALAKSVAAMLTGSASLLAEAAHSWADAGNEIFLLVAERRSTREKDAEHPLGYGREAYFWSLFAAFGLFLVGAVLSIGNGINALLNPEPAENFVLGYVVLAVSFVLEGISLSQSIVQARKTASGYHRRTLSYVVNGSNPTLRAVVAEDSAALVGLAIAAIGLALHQLTGSSVYDAIGSILIGLLLGVVAAVLIDRNRRFLVGAEPPARNRAEAGRALLAQDDIVRVTYLHLEFVGPGRLYLVAAVDLAGDRPEGEVARRLRRIEQQIEEIELIDTAILTLAVSDEPSLEF